MKTFDGYKKQALTDVYALLAGGGHKPLSEFSMAHTHPYLPLSGGTITGNIILKGGTSPDMTYAGNVHPYIRFDNSDSSLNVSLIFTDYDSYRRPAGIKLVGNQSNEWFEATNIYATTFYGALSGNASSATTATKLTSSAGSATLPIYFSNGKPVACTASSVFSNLSNSGNNISVTVAGQNRTLTVGYADTVDGYHASKVYNAPTFIVNNAHTSNTYVLLATITISGTSLDCAEFTTLFQNRECLDNSSFILSGAIRRNSTTNVGATLSYITLHTGTPRNIYMRSDDGVTFRVYIQSVSGSWTTYYRAIPIVDSGNITYSNTGTTSPISGSVLNITATKGGNTNYANSAGNADTLDGYHASSFATSSHTHSYLPLSGGTMLGSIKFNSNSLPQKTLSYVCGIDAFADGGEMGWMSGSDFVAQYAPTKTGIGALGTWSISVSGNAATATNADKVDGYHASNLWRSDGATWNPGANVSLTANANGQEWSFDIRRNGYTGCYWHVWDSVLNSLLKVNADNGKVYAPYNFVGNLEGNASSATALTTSAGSATLPIYFNGGKPVACTASSIFSNLSNNGNNLSITIAGLNRLLTIAYASTTSKLISRGNLVAYEEGSTTKGESGVNFYTVYNNGYPVTYGNLLHINGSGAGLLLAEWCGNATLGHLYYRSKRDNSEHGWSAWGKIAFVTDNVATASKWLTARKITLSGSVTGSVSLDGSGDVTLATITNHTHNWTNIEGKPSTFTPSTHTHSFITIPACSTLNINSDNFSVEYAGGNNSVTTKPSGVDAFGVMKLRTAAGWYGQIMMSTNTAPGMYYRNANGLTSSIGWIKLLDSSNSNVSGGGSAWGSSITVNINGTSKTLTIPGNPNTDYRVTQSETTTANYRPLVLGYTNVNTAGSGMTGSVTNQVYLSNKFYVQPSTGNLYATNFVGALSGNASTATKLQTSRTIWGQRFDGTADITGVMTINPPTITSGRDNTIMFKVYSSTGYKNGFAISSTDNVTRLYAKPFGTGTKNALEIHTYNNTDVNAVTIDATGNVGIGTTSPTYKLHVAGDIYTTKGFKKNGSSDSYVLLGGGGHKLVSDFAISNHAHSWGSITNKPCTLISYSRNGENINANNWRVKECSLIEIRNKELTYSNLAMSGFNSFFNFWTPDGIICTQFQIGDGAFYYRSKQSGSATITTNWYKLMDSNNCSVSKSGETLTVKINGTSQSLTNTWRGILDNLISSTNTTQSLSAKQGYLLANGYARDNTKLPLSGGTMTGVIKSTFSSSTWINGVTNAIVKGEYTDYGAILSMPVKTGRVSLSSYPANNNNIYFGYATTAQISAGTNSFNKQMYWDAVNNNLHADVFTGSLAGNASTATTATKLGTADVGATNVPIYLKAGVPTSVTLIDTANNLINNLTTGTSTPVDADYYVAQYVGGGTTTTTFHRRPHSALYTYIKNKANGTWGISITGNAATATTVGALYNTSKSDPGSACSDGQNVKWFSSIVASSNYAGTNAGFPVTNNANGILWLGTHSGPYGWQMGFSSNSRIYARYINNNTFPTTANGGSWNKIAWTSDIPTKSSWNYDDVYSKLGHTHDDRYYTESEINNKLGAYLPLSGGTMTGNIKYTKKGTSYIGNGENDAANGVGGALNNLVISSWYGVSFTTSCRGQTYTGTNAVSINCRNGYVYANTFVGSFSGNASTATNADKVDGYHASDLVKFYLSPMTTDASADSAKSWFTNTMPSGSGAIIYNVPGLEKTIIAGKSVGAYGHMLQLNYDDTYLRILRYYGGSWKSTDWEKISAGYADSAGNADTLDGCHASTFATAGHTHTLTLENNDGANPIKLAHGGKYKLTAGGSSIIFTLPTSNNVDPTNYYWANINVSTTSSTKTSPTFSKVMINTTTSKYQLNVDGDSYVTGWSHAASGFHCVSYGVYFTHNNSLTSAGEIDMTSTNEFCWGAKESTLYFNYRAASRGTTVTKYIWNAGSKSTYASHTMGDITATGINVSGNIYATHFYENSDIRYKKVLRNLSINSNTIATLPLFDFEWIENNTIGTGTSAQAVQQILPNLVSGTDKLTLDYGVLGTIAGITACKELVTLKSELQQLKEKVKLLEDKLRKYENI